MNLEYLFDFEKRREIEISLMKIVIEKKKRDFIFTLFILINIVSNIYTRAPDGLGEAQPSPARPIPAQPMG
jgi:hypothetical protein